MNKEHELHPLLKITTSLAILSLVGCSVWAQYLFGFATWVETFTYPIVATAVVGILGLALSVFVFFSSYEMVLIFKEKRRQRMSRF